MSKIFELKIQLNGVTKPPIWRVIEIASGDSLYDLHNVIQGAMGWTNSHLHQFIIDELNFGIPTPYDDFIEVHDERKVKISEKFEDIKDTILYEYDFGDGWQHDLSLQAVKEADKGVEYPRLIDGKGMCPPEDCGGIGGFMELTEIINDPNHSDHEDMLIWLDLESADQFDLEYFDMQEHQLDMHAMYKAGKKNKGKEFLE